MAKLSPDAIRQQLQSLSGWELKDNAISKLFRFDEFLEGIEFVHRSEPNCKIWCGAIDDELTAKGYIVPGLGDAGDLAFGSKVQM